MNAEPELSTLRLAILCLLLKEPTSGYQLKKDFEQTPMGHFSTSPGAIYPALKRMEEEGWIAGSPEDTGSTRPARMLSLTDQGIALLKRYFQRPVTVDDVVLGMDRLMLRFAFTTPLLGREATCRFLEQFIQALSNQLEIVREVSREIRNEPLEGRLALEHGLRAYESTLAWARDALAKLNGQDT